MPLRGRPWGGLRLLQSPHLCPSSPSAVSLQPGSLQVVARGIPFYCWITNHPHLNGLEQHGLLCSQICQLGRAQRAGLSLLPSALPPATQGPGVGTVCSLLRSRA